MFDPVIRFELAEWQDYPPEDYQTHPRPTYDVHCPGCGRFARNAGIRYGYNGHHTTETITTDCSQCGKLDSALV